jgi:hypothetical protein
LFEKPNSFLLLNSIINGVTMEEELLINESYSCRFFKKAGQIAGYTALGAAFGGVTVAVGAAVLVTTGGSVPAILPSIAIGAAVGGTLGFSGAVCCPTYMKENISLSN